MCTESITNLANSFYLQFSQDANQGPNCPCLKGSFSRILGEARTSVTDSS